MSGEWDPISRTATLPHSVLAPGSAREILTETCSDAQVPDPITQTALLLTSEMVTNAITHGAGEPGLTIVVAADRIRIGVSDQGDGRPCVVPDPARLTEHGRGVWLINRLAARWGVEALDSARKVVWFELDRERPAPLPA